MFNALDFDRILNTNESVKIKNDAGLLIISHNIQLPFLFFCILERAAVPLTTALSSRNSYC